MNLCAVLRSGNRLMTEPVIYARPQGRADRRPKSLGLARKKHLPLADAFFLAGRSGIGLELFIWLRRLRRLTR